MQGSEEEFNLARLVECWIKDQPRFKDHYTMVSNDAGGIKLYWLRCECVEINTMPPIPGHEVLIQDNDLVLATYNKKAKNWKEKIISPHDPKIFDKLEAFLDHSHELGIP